MLMRRRVRSLLRLRWSMMSEPRQGSWGNDVLGCCGADKGKIVADCKIPFCWRWLILLNYAEMFF
jgi:hypothetical protein